MLLLLLLPLGPLFGLFLKVKVEKQVAIEVSLTKERYSLGIGARRANPRMEQVF
jgi:hypothetical protein